MLSQFADCAERAEWLRRQGGEVVFVTGAELYRWTAMTGRRSTSCPLTSTGRRRSQTKSTVGVRATVARGKPVAITEFGSATLHGAGDPGTRGLEIVEYDYDTRAPVRLDGEYVRDEDGQAAYLRELLEVFDSEHVDSSFVFLFALYDHPHRPGGDPREDLDLASYGIVKVFDDRRGDTYPEMPWEPKAAFAAVAEYYRDH